MSCVALSILSGGVYAFAGNSTEVNGQPVGLLSYHFPQVTEMQEQLGVIDARLQAMVHELSEIGDTVSAIQQDTGELVRQSSMNLGQINNAMSVGDLQSLQRAGEQGFNFDLVHNTLGGNITHTHLVMAMRSNRHNIDEVLDFLDDQGSLDVQQVITARNAFPTDLQSEINAHIANNNASVRHGNQVIAINERLSEKQNELNALNQEIQACRQQNQVAGHQVIQRAGEIRLQQHRDARAYNRDREFELIDQYNEERAADTEIAQAEWDQRRDELLDDIRSGDIGAGTEAMVWRTALQMGTAVPELGVEDRPRVPTPTTTLPAGYFEPRPMMTMEEAEAQARQEMGSGSVSCGDSSTLAAEVESLRQEAQTLAQSGAAMDHRPPQPTNFRSNLLLEATFANNRQAIDWLIANGGDPGMPGQLEFSDGSVLEVTPAQLM